MKWHEPMLLIGAFAAAVASPVAAQQYPVRPIRLIVASAPGGAPDILGRAVAQKLTESLGQQVVVDNRAGASGIIGAELTARAAPDGYTLLLGATTILAILPTLNQKLPYDPARDLTPITLIATAANVVVVHAGVGAKNIAELVRAAKEKPLNFASAGNGTPAHLAGEMLNLMAGIRMAHVPYKGAGPALTDLLAGAVQVLITSPIAALPHAQSGKLRLLATTGAQRNPTLPDLPTVAETIPGYEITQWWGLNAPAATPRAIVDRLQKDTARSLQQPDVKERLQAQGAIAIGSTPEEFGRFIAAERSRIAKLVKQAGIAPSP
ncbi:MAG: tripartite tricarboxylate transporter substrate binding protein [Rhodospirillaceae bacterium]